VNDEVFVDDGEVDEMLGEVEDHIACLRRQFELLTEENSRLWLKARKLGEYAARLRLRSKPIAVIP
jgi:regulator of replication initiation timing